MPVSQNWVGNAPAVAQVETDTLTVTWIIGETITVTFGNNTAYVYTIASTVIATITAALAAALNALSSTAYPEFAAGEIVWSSSATALIATAGTPGKPFTYVITTNSAAGVITPVATTASKGPNDWSTAANWSGNTVPAAGDTVILDYEGGKILYGLDQHTVTIAALRIVAKQFTLGLPLTNVDASPYPEYRPDSLKIGCTSAYINSPKSGRIKIDFYTVQTACLVSASGNGLEANVPAVLLKGTHVSNSFTFNGGSIGLGFFASAASTALTLTCGTGATVTCGAGCTLDTINNLGATLTINSAVVTLLHHPTSSSKALTTVLGTGAVAQLTMQGGTCDYQTSGNLAGTTIMANGAVLTFDNDARAKTITNPPTAYSTSCKVFDTFGVIAAGLSVSWINCQPGTMGVRSNVTLATTLL
jgi:hypothetical protein